MPNIDDIIMLLLVERISGRRFEVDCIDLQKCVLRCFDAGAVAGTQDLKHSKNVIIQLVHLTFYPSNTICIVY